MVMLSMIPTKEETGSIRVLSGNTVRAKALAQLFDAKNVVARMAGVGPWCILILGSVFFIWVCGKGVR